jgi:hypothetical protein
MFSADSSPAARRHLRQVVARGANATQYVELKQVEPLLIGLIEEIVWPCGAGVVDQNVGVRRVCDQRRAAFRSGDVGGNAAQFGVRQ